MYNASLFYFKWLILILFLIQCLVTELRDGELIHGDNFNLYAAMSALEVISYIFILIWYYLFD